MARRPPDWQRFTIVSELGAGGFGRTLLVKDAEHGDRLVAIKVPTTTEAEDVLIEEYGNNRALGTLSHPNLVKCFGIARYEGARVMVMEYVKGGDLRRILGPASAQRRPMMLRHAFSVFADACKGLAAVHSVKIVHCDIKPENILVREDGVAKLTDFGISKVIQSTMMSGKGTGGTLPYMAPEVFRGEADYPSDIWSLSVTLYEMLTGRLPFLAPNLFALQEKITREDPVRPAEINPDVDDRLEAAILRGLEKDPRKRFSSAAEQLQAVVSEPDLDEPIAAAKRLSAAGNDTEAERQIRSLLADHPTVAKLYLALAELHNKKLDYQSAEQALRDGLDHCPDHPVLLFYLAPALWNQGVSKRAQARKLLEDAIRLVLAPTHQKQARMMLDRWKAGKG